MSKNKMNITNKLGPNPTTNKIILGGDYPPTNCSPCEFCEDEKKWAAHYKEQRDLWVERFRKALEVHAGTLHCREDCNCTNRKTLRELESFLPENLSEERKDSDRLENKEL